MINTKQTVDIKKLELNKATSFFLEIVSKNINNSFSNIFKENFFINNFNIKCISSNAYDNKYILLFKNSLSGKKEIFQMENSKDHLYAFISTLLFLYKQEIKSITLTNIVYNDMKDSTNVLNVEKILYFKEKEDSDEIKILNPTKKTMELTYQFFLNLVEKKVILHKKIYAYLQKEDYNNREMTYVSEFINMEMLLIYKYGRKENILTSLDRFLKEINIRNIEVENRERVISRYLVEIRNSIIHGNSDVNHREEKLDVVNLILKEINLLLLMNLINLDDFYISQKLSSEKYMKPYWAKEKFEMKIDSIQQNNENYSPKTPSFLNLIRMFNSFLTNDENIRIFHYISLKNNHLALIEVNEQVFTFYTKDNGTSFKIAFTDELQWLSIDKEKYQNNLLSYRNFIVGNLKIEAKNSKYKDVITNEFVKMKNEIFNKIEKINATKERVYSVSCELKDVSLVNLQISRNNEKSTKLNKNEKFSTFVNFANIIKDKNEQELSFFLDSNSHQNNIIACCLLLLIDSKKMLEASNLLNTYKSSFKNKLTTDIVEEVIFSLIQNKLVHISTYHSKDILYRIYLKKKIKEDFTTSELYTLNFNSKNILVGIQRQEYETIEWSR